MHKLEKSAGGASLPLARTRLEFAEHRIYQAGDDIPHWIGKLLQNGHALY